MDCREEALAYPRGSINLCFCYRCGFMWNDEFDPRMEEYSPRYEEVQTYSPTFLSFQRELAEDLIRRLDLRRKTILEIGCGKGEFLALLAELGGNRGIGFDPSYREGRLGSSARDRVTFIRDFYSEKYSHLVCDLVCCKMTLEHIQDVGSFLAAVRRAIGARKQTRAFFQVPAMERILEEGAFWDVYYEHCSYFCRQSLGRLFLRSGFEVRDLWTAYEDQYLMIEAAPAETSRIVDVDVSRIAAAVQSFDGKVTASRKYWRSLLEGEARRAHRVVVWGGGSKAVAFLTTLGAASYVDYVVDVNPNKSGTFLPGTGHPVFAPDTLSERPADLVVLMNPVYMREVREWLDARAMHPRVEALEAVVPSSGLPAEVAG